MNKIGFLAKLTVIFLILLFIVSYILLFFTGASITDIRLSSQFKKDLNKFKTQQYLIDHFETYEDTQRINLDGSNDFSEYSSKGMVIGWADVRDYTQIKSIDLELCDSSSCHTIKGLDNKPELARTQNEIWSDDEFTDYSFKCSQSNSVWRDWMLVDGENMVFWEWDKSIPINMSHVRVKTSYPIRDAFIIKQFCINETPTNGNWIAPYGLIQYGFHYIENGSLFMKNVRQAQMVTNGDHARIISNTKGTPRNFILKIQFSPTNVQNIPTKNDYIRIAWDFEDKWDAGHDQTLIYLTHEYEYFGMQRVFPVIRQKEQGYENSPKVSFRLENNRVYEINVRVQGQTAKSIIYERRFGLLWEKASIEYTFKTPRPTESYPFSIESTGNPNLRVDSIEIWQILEGVRGKL